MACEPATHHLRSPATFCDITWKTTQAIDTAYGLPRAVVGSLKGVRSSLGQILADQVTNRHCPSGGKGTSWAPQRFKHLPDSHCYCPRISGRCPTPSCLPGALPGSNSESRMSPENPQSPANQGGWLLLKLVRSGQSRNHVGRYKRKRKAQGNCRELLWILTVTQELGFIHKVIKEQSAGGGA